MPLIDARDFFDPEAIARRQQQASTRADPRLFGACGLVHGKPGSGKSSLAFQFALNVAVGRSFSVAAGANGGGRNSGNATTGDVRGGAPARVVILCSKSACNSKPPKPQSPMQQFHQDDLTRIEYTYVNTLSDVRRQLAILGVTASRRNRQPLTPSGGQQQQGGGGDGELLVESQGGGYEDEFMGDGDEPLLLPPQSGGAPQQPQGLAPPPATPIGLVIVDDDGLLDLASSNNGRTSGGGDPHGGPSSSWSLQSDTKAAFLKTVAVLNHTVSVLGRSQLGDGAEMNVPALWVSNTAGTLHLGGATGSSALGDALLVPGTAALAAPIEAPFSVFPISICVIDSPDQATAPPSHYNQQSMQPQMLKVMFSQLPTALPLGVDPQTKNEAPSLDYGFSRHRGATSQDGGPGWQDLGGQSGAGSDHWYKQQAMLAELDKAGGHSDPPPGVLSAHIAVGTHHIEVRTQLA